MIYPYGASDGPLAFYFHGAPGGHEECAHFDQLARESGVRLVGIERGEIGGRYNGESYFRRLAATVEEAAAGRPFSVIAFSLGACAALRMLPHLERPPEQLHLISAAAPLEPGMLDAMAGKAVFQLAMRAPRALARLTTVQAWLARHAPAVLFSMLFASARGGDRALAADPSFRVWISGVLNASLGERSAAYLRDVLAFVEPWAPEVSGQRPAIRIWHGAEDNWSPPRMALALSQMQGAQLTLFDGLSHYSCLVRAMPLVLAEIRDTA